MRIRGSNLKHISVMLIILLFFCFSAPVFAAGGGSSAQRPSGYNIVFVMDTSASLTETDPDGVRHQGLGTFLSWLLGTNSQVGLVTFSHDVTIFEEKLRPLASKQDIEAIYEASKKIPEGGTDLEKALEIALKFFTPEKGANPDFQNLIIVFTDGQLGLSSKSGFVNEIKSKNIQVATILLGSTGITSNQLSRVLGDGLFYAIRTAQDIPTAVENIYSSIFNSKILHLNPGLASISVPPLGDSPLTISYALDSPDDEFELISPDGQIFTHLDTLKIESLNTLTIERPMPGLWSLNITSGNFTAVIPQAANIAGDNVEIIPQTANVGAWEKFFNIVASPAFEVAFAILASGGIAAFFTKFVNELNRRTNKKDAEEVKNEINIIVEKIKDSETVIDLMVKNVSELREYYIISKRQANKSFSTALVVCILGFCVFVLGMFINLYGNQNIIIYTTISGGIVEVISGLFFWLYRQTTGQLNIYHERLGTTEKYLTVMQLIEKMSPDKHDENYRFLIESILKDNSLVLGEKNNSSKE